MKKRPYHCWKPNKTSQRPSHVVFVDVESNFIPRGAKFNEHTLKLGWACYQGYQNTGHSRKPDWIHFENPETFWSFVEDHALKDTRLYIIGHGIGYDVGILRLSATAKKRGWKETFSFSKGKTYIARYKTSKGSLVILSTTNFFPLPLSTLGELVGVSKLEVDFETVSKENLSFYCKRDVEVLKAVWETWVRFLDDHNLGTFQQTIASQAFTAYRHRFMSTPVFIHGDMEVCQLERAAYRGGRCEVFRVGEFQPGEYYKLDVNGLYGYIMATSKLPHKLLGHRENVSVDFLRHKLRNRGVIAKVTLHTNLPVFPIKHNGVNCYPTGTFVSVLTTPELVFTLEHCTILEVKEIAWYRQDYILRDYAKYFASLKSEYSETGNRAFRTIAKLFNNALYGKLAQRDYRDLKKDEAGNASSLGFGKEGRKALVKKVEGLIRLGWDKWGEAIWDNAPRASLGPNVKTTRLEKWSVWELLGKRPKMRHTLHQGDKRVGAHTIVRPKGWVSATEAKRQYGESYNSFPAISAHVTAHARMYLWGLLERAGRENVFYCDTDGFICNGRGYENCLNMLDDYKSGHLKVEDKSNSLTILRRKGYIMSDKRTICGIRHNAKEIAPLVFEQDQFLGIPGAIREGNPDLRGVTRVIKQVNTDIKGGDVLPTGWVKPFKLDMRGEVSDEITKE